MSRELKLFTAELDYDEFSELLIQQLGADPGLKCLLDEGHAVKRVRAQIEKQNLGADNFRRGGSHYSPWLDQALHLFEAFDPAKLAPLAITKAYEHERRKDPESTYLISDGSHRALVLTVLGLQAPVKVILADGDRKGLEDLEPKVKI